mmetsp:Transcript_45356/g.140580  ORF Transcript_45356/g.140580 Transcript_45356/m.140580 type:complete len:298 (-) Transcript_45356:88-981(-)
MAGCTSTLSDTCKADTAVNAQCRSSSAPQHAASASKPAWMATPESMPPSCLRSSAGVPLCMDAPVQICINRESCHTAGSSCGGRSSWESSAPVLARPSAQAPSASTLGGRRVVAATLSASNAAQEWTLGKALLTTATNGCPGGFSAPRRMSTVWAHSGGEGSLTRPSRAMMMSISIWVTRLCWLKSCPRLSNTVETTLSLKRPSSMAAVELHFSTTRTAAAMQAGVARRPSRGQPGSTTRANASRSVRTDGSSNSTSCWDIRMRSSCTALTRSVFAKALPLFCLELPKTTFSHSDHR